MKKHASFSNLASRISHLASRISHLASRISLLASLLLQLGKLRKGNAFSTRALAMLLCAYSAFGIVNNASALVTHVVYLGPTTFAGCGTDACCQAFRVYANVGEEITITLNPNFSSYDCSCLDASCWNSQYDNGTSHGMFHTSAVSNCLEYHCFADGDPLFPDDSFTVYICGTIDCWKQFPTFNYFINDNPHSGDVNLALSLCTGEFENCAGCPWVNAFDMGCYEDIVFHNTSNNCLASFQLMFQPPLKNCNGASDNPTGGPMKCVGSSITLIPFSHQPNWNWTLSGADSIMTIYNTDSFHTCMPACTDFHIFIPKCNTQVSHTVTVLPIVFPCNEHTTIAFKRTAGPSHIDDAEANFPNPLEAISGFRTAIPFTTTGPQRAIIKIVNESGQRILDETMETLSGGKHYFYFSGTRLPAGRYFYLIESPIGNVIASKTLLLVK